MTDKTPEKAKGQEPKPVYQPIDLEGMAGILEEFRNSRTFVVADELPSGTTPHLMDYAWINITPEASSMRDQLYLEAAFRGLGGVVTPTNHPGISQNKFAGDRIVLTNPGAVVVLYWFHKEVRRNFDGDAASPIIKEANGVLEQATKVPNQDGLSSTAETGEEIKFSVRPSK